MSSTPISDTSPISATAPATAPAPALDDFRKALDTIVKSYGKAQSALTIVFRACLRDLFHSKSVDRLNMAAKALSALPVWPEFCRRIRLAYGGTVFNGEKAIDNNSLAAVHYVKKFNGFIRQDMPETVFKSHLAFFDAKLSGMDWNEYKYSRAEKPVSITSKDIRAAYLKIRDNKSAWSADDRATLEKVLTALAGVLD